MEVVRDGIWLCVDCTIAACNGDVTGAESDERVAAIWAGLEAFGPHLVPDFDSESGEGIEEFRPYRCESCGCGAGEQHRFAVLGETAASVVVEYTLYIANLPPLKLTRESALTLWKHSGFRFRTSFGARGVSRIYVMRATPSCGETFNFGITVRRSA